MKRGWIILAMLWALTLWSGVATAEDLRAAQADLPPSSGPEILSPRGAKPTLHLSSSQPLTTPYDLQFPGVTAIPDKTSDPQVLALPLDPAAGLGVRVAADSSVVAAPHQRNDDEISLIGLIELRQPLN